MDEFSYAIEKERAWVAKRNKMDTGSYCEEESHQAKTASKIIKAYQDLSQVLIEYERNGYKL